MSANAAQVACCKSANAATADSQVPGQPAASSSLGRVSLSLLLRNRLPPSRRSSAKTDQRQNAATAVGRRPPSTSADPRETHASLVWRLHIPPPARPLPSSLIHGDNPRGGGRRRSLETTDWKIPSRQFESGHLGLSVLGAEGSGASFRHELLLLLLLQIFLSSQSLRSVLFSALPSHQCGKHVIHSFVRRARICFLRIP